MTSSCFSGKNIIELQGCSLNELNAFIKYVCNALKNDSYIWQTVTNFPGPTEQGGAMETIGFPSTGPDRNLFFAEMTLFNYYFLPFSVRFWVYSQHGVKFPRTFDILETIINKNQIYLDLTFLHFEFKSLYLHR